MAENNTEKQRVQELTDKLEQGLQDLFNSDSYCNYLRTMSKFHNYSFNNTLLIAMQKPDATLVAGYKAWQKNFERHVNKGEKAIRILAPAPYKIKEERDKIDPVTQELLLDKDGNPQKEEVEITIPAFRAVSVFDVAQTDGKPIPELAAKELLSDVEGYQDMIRAVEAISPVPIELEEIAGDSKGYYDREAKRIAVQENMSESQTLKTMIHEVAHSKLHSKEVEQDEQMKKDRNTKEVEAESIAYTVCQHFGIDTSDYSFGYIAGWSSGRDTKELRSSMDTIRRTASELITGIEEQLQELQRSREVSQEQTKESILLIQNTDLSEFSLLDVYGMDRPELMQALSEMTDDDKLSIQAYLESRGAWTTEIGNQDSREYGEYHLDVRYNTDTDELIDMKERKAVYDKAMEPINADDVVVKFASIFESEWEVLKITNMLRDDVGKMLKDMASLDEKEWDGNYLSYMEKQGAEITLLASSSKELNGNMPDFWDYEYDFDAGLTDAEELSVMQQAEHIINRLEHGQPAFSDDERNLIVNYAYKLGDIEKTRELAEHIYAQEVDGNQDVALAMIDAEAEIDALPDSMVSISEMQEYGYTWNEMFPLTQERAIELFDHDLPVYLLHTDGSETTVSDRKQITEHDGMCGIEKGDWLNERKLQMMQEELSESDSNREAQLLYGNTDKYGIFQLKDDPELDKFRFEGTESLKRMGITKDNFDAVLPENYKLVYLGELSELQGQTQSETLEAIYEQFNIAHPEDYRGHSLSVSDIVVLNDGKKVTAHFVDSISFEQLDSFLNLEEQVLSELAYEVGERYFAIQRTEEGYDYSFYDEDFRLMDGGVYENDQISIEEAAEELLKDEGWIGERIRGDYDQLMEKVEEMDEVVMAEIQKSQGEYKPLAKVEELEEANYNMIDNVLNNMPPKKEPYLEYFATECDEFHDMGAYEKSTDVNQIAAVYEKYRENPKTAYLGCSMGIIYRDPEDSYYDEAEFAIVKGNTVFGDLMDDVRFYGELALVREGIEKIHEALPDYKYVPMRDVREAMYPEKMTTEQLAEALDEIAEAFDPYEYRDNVERGENTVQEVMLDLRSGNIHSYISYLKDIVDEECDLSVRAGVLIERLKAYEPELPKDMEPMVYVNYCEESDLMNPRCQKLSELDAKTAEMDKEWYAKRDPKTEEPTKIAKIYVTVYYAEKGEQKLLH